MVDIDVLSFVLTDLEDAEDHLLKVLLDRKLERNYSKRGTAWRFGKRDDNSFLLRDIKNLLDNASGKPYPDTEIGYKDKYLTADGFGRPEGYTNDKRGTAWRFG